MLWCGFWFSAGEREKLTIIWNRTQHDIFTASQQGKTELIRALIESGRARATDRDDDRITPLHWAAINGRLGACAYLIQQGAEVNAVGGDLDATPLQWAARNGLVETIDLLIRHGADPHLFDTQGFNCLHSIAHSSNYWALVYILCQPDIAVDERDRMDHTPLHWAVYQRDEVSTQILLKMGADPDAVGRDGLTSLHWAAFTGNKRCITQLLEAGADIRAKSGDGRTAYEIAAEFGNKDIWNLVVEELGFKPDGARVRRPLDEVRGCPGATGAGIKQV
jgi:ankyrin repeat protein